MEFTDTQSLNSPTREVIEICDLTDHPQYLGTLAGWHQQQWAHLNPGETLAMRVQRMRGYLLEPFIPTMYIAREDDKLLGSAMIVIDEMETHLELGPWLASVYIDERYRKLGIGSLLVRHVMAKAKENGVATLYLYTPDQAPFYQHLGWQILDEECYQGETVTLMKIGL